MNKTQREKMSQGKLMLLGIAREMRIARKSHCKRLQGEIVLQENARENNVANNHQKKNDAARESQAKIQLAKTCKEKIASPGIVKHTGETIASQRMAKMK